MVESKFKYHLLKPLKKENPHWPYIIHEQLVISFEGVFDVVNTTIKEAKIVLKRIVGIIFFLSKMNNGV